jgi:hypothetical protein
MKKLKKSMTLLVMTIVGLVSLLSCSDNESVESITLLFRNAPAENRRSADSLFSLTVEITSFEPLVVKSDFVTVVETVAENNEKVSGLVLTEDWKKRLIVTPGYIFNNATQCWIWGAYTANTATGQTTWSAGTASEQVYHNVCPPRGEMYCRKK